MTDRIVLLVLFAALLHASWNALLRSGEDKLWSMTMMCVAVAGCSAVAAWVLPMPAFQSWPYAVLSAVLHVGYNLFLVRSYEAGDLGRTYPVARGSSPILITLGAVVFAGEALSWLTAAGVLVISLGIIGLALGRHRLSSTGLRSALGTGCFIAAYSVTDGMGVRLAAHPMAYTAWMCAMWGVLMPLVYISRRDAPSLFAPRPGRYTALMGGVISLVAYGLVIHAMQVAPMGAVSALRETSVLFAALIGYVFLGESLSLQKCAACVVITTGIFIVG